MTKLNYDSPELEIRWFESEDVIAYSDPIIVDRDEDAIAPDDEW